MELTGDALDLAVAKCEPDDTVRIYFDEDTGEKLCHDDWDIPEFSPSTDWLQGGAIIERESIFVLREQSGFKGRRLWAATSGASKAIGLNDDSVKLYRDAFYFGPAPLIAAMRCYVASKLGDEVELPKEITK